MNANVDSRRYFMKHMAAAAGAIAVSGVIPEVTVAQSAPAALDEARRRGRDLAGQIGITTGSFMRHLSPEPLPGKLVLLDLPRIMREELDLRVIDLMTATLISLDPAYCDKLRAATEKAGCVLTNLKMNQPLLDMASPDEALRRKSLDVYKQSIDAAARLGVRWVRPLPGPALPELKWLAASYRELIDYAADKKISLLIENYGWMKDDPNAIPRVIEMVGKDLAAQPDTGNWTAAARYRGLERAFPFAVSCDFKAFTLGPQGEHTDYDLRRCFEIGWKAGFRGPWCFEHFHADLPSLLKEMILLRDLLRAWMKEQSP